VPAAANFVSLRRVAGTSHAGRPWFGLGDFKPITLAQAERTFPGPACQESAKLFAGLPRLPFAGRELEAARALLGGAKQDELEGAAYTVPDVTRARLKDYRILHFASHALLPAELKCSQEPAIVTSAPPGAATASGALLTSSLISTMDLDADAVILSACNSAGPNGPAGESLSGLARAFFYAGARSMLVTHWSVNDQTSAFLVADTLRRLKGGKDGGLAGSLRGAELGLLAEAGKGMPTEIAHPFYWAPFALIGEGGVPARTADLVGSRSPLL
jgi:CHAT domain-containing protein